MCTTEVLRRDGCRADMIMKTSLCLEVQSADTSSAGCSVDLNEACVSHLVVAWQDLTLAPVGAWHGRSINLYILIFTISSFQESVTESKVTGSLSRDLHGADFIWVRIDIARGSAARGCDKGNS